MVPSYPDRSLLVALISPSGQGSGAHKVIHTPPRILIHVIGLYKLKGIL